MLSNLSVPHCTVIMPAMNEASSVASNQSVNYDKAMYLAKILAISVNTSLPMNEVFSSPNLIPPYMSLKDQLVRWYLI